MNMKQLRNFTSARVSHVGFTQTNATTFWNRNIMLSSTWLMIRYYRAWLIDYAETKLKLGIKDIEYSIKSIDM